MRVVHKMCEYKHCKTCTCPNGRHCIQCTNKNMYTLLLAINLNIALSGTVYFSVCVSPKCMNGQLLNLKAEEKI